jgi:Fe-S cluster biogenesis protein NfuA
MNRLFNGIVAAFVVVLTAACGGGTTGGTPPAIHSFTVDKAVVNLGETATLRWDVSNATSLFIEPDVGDVTSIAEDFSTGYPDQTREYTLIAKNGAGEVRRTLRIEVKELPTEVVVPETTKVADEVTRSSLASFDEATGVFRFTNATPTLESLSVGDVLVSEPTDAAPYGFLRKITAIQNESGMVVLQSEEASLEEAIHQGEIEFEQELNPEDVVEAEALMEGLTFHYMDDDISAQSIGTQALRFSISFDQAVYDKDGNSATRDDQVRINGSFKFAPKVNKKWVSRLEVKRRCWYCLPEFTLRLQAKLTVGFEQNADLTIRTTGQLTGSVAKEIPVARYSFNPITFSIGPVPVVLVPQITIVIGANAQVEAHASFTVAQSLKYEVGAEYNGGLRTINSFTPTFTRKLEDFSYGSFKARGYVNANANVTFYGSSSNYVGASAMGYLDVDARVPRTPAWTLHAGVECRVRYNLKIWKWTIGKGESKVCDVRREIARGNVSGPHTLTVNKAGNGQGTIISTPSGINCGSTCSHTFNHGTRVTLTPTPTENALFTGWSGACSGTGSCSITMDAAKSVTATFATELHTLTVTRAGTGQGNIQSTPSGIDCGETCSYTFAANTTVTLAATPADGSFFIGWSGACSGTMSCTVTLETAKSVSANFAAMPITAGTVSVRVRDAATSAPVRDVSILVCDATDSCFAPHVKEPRYGSYNFNVPVGTMYDLRFVKGGYIDAAYRGIKLEEQGKIVYLEQLLFISSSQIRGSASGIVTNAVTGGPIDAVTVSLREGINMREGPVLASTMTDAAGMYSFSNLGAGNYTAEASKSGFITTHFTVAVIGGQTKGDQNTSISPVLPEGQWRIVLTWGEIPQDLDAHFTGPEFQDDSRFHVYFDNRAYEHEEILYVELDVDATRGFGPETITLYRDTTGYGVYRFLVHDYSNRASQDSSALASSQARVRVFKGSSLMRTFDVPNLDGTLWTVFQLDHDRDGDDGLLEINTMSYHEIPEQVDW